MRSPVASVFAEITLRVYGHMLTLILVASVRREN